LEAVRLFEEAQQHSEALGWSFFPRKEEVDIYLTVRPDGTGTRGIGIGRIGATVEQVQEVHDQERFKAVLDKQWEMTKPLGAVPPKLIHIPGWDVLQCTLQQSLYRSPAWPVSPRESCTLMLQLRNKADGSFRLLQRSVAVPGCETPSGYTRITLAVGGFNLSPISKELGKEVTEMLYLNVLDPNGSIPKVVVKRTVPERCLSVARARKCCAELAK